MKCRNQKKQISLEDDEEFSKFYEREQLLQLLDAFKQNRNTMILFHLLSYSGMRKGEALALTWAYINFEDNEIRINKAISHGRDCQLYLKTTKNGIARKIGMDQQSLDLLAEWKDEQAKKLIRKQRKSSLYLLI